MAVTKTPSNNPKNPKNSPSRKFDAPIESDIYKEEKPSPLSIEGIRSGAVQSKIFKGFILLSGLVMAGGLVISGLNPTGQGPINQRGGRAATTAAIATVGDRSISGVQLENTFANQVRMGEQFGQKITALDYLPSKQRALQSLTDQSATILAAQAAGITVSDAEIDAKIDELTKERLKPQQGQSEAAARRLIEAQHGSVEAYQETLRKDYDRAAVSDFLLTDKLEKQVKAANKVSEADYKQSVTKLHLYQIVVRPAFPTPGAKDLQAEVAKNAVAAQDKAAKLFGQLKAAPELANFQATAKKSSDDLVTKAKGGDLGFKTPSEVYYGPEISAALATSKGDLVGPLKDTSGNQYLFFIAGRKLELPKDYAKNSKKLLADFETQQDNAAWQKQQETYKKAQTPEIADDALAAYQIQSVALTTATGDAQKKLREDAIARYTGALSGAGGLEAASINYQLAGLYRDQNDKPKQLSALEQAVKAAPSEPNLRLEYARALRLGGQPKLALEQLKAASTAVGASPSPPSPFGGGNPDDALRQQIAAEYDGLKEAKLAAAERAKIKPAAPGQMGGMGGLPPGMSIAPQGK